MVRIYGHFRNELPPEAYREKEDKGCEFVLEPDSWNKNNPTKSLTKNWYCPYKPESNSNYCRLHQPVDSKDPIQVQEWLRQKINDVSGGDMIPLIGGKFGDIDIAQILSDSSDKYTTLLFWNCEFQEQVSFRRSEIRATIYFTGSIFHKNIIIRDCDLLGKLSLEDTRFYRSYSDDSCVNIFNSKFREDFSLEKSIIQNSVHITESIFHGEFSLKKSIFCSISTFQLNRFYDDFNASHAVFADTTSEHCAAFQNSKFSSDVSLVKSEFYDTSDWERANIQSDLRFHHASFDSTIIFKDMTVKGDVRLYNTQLPSNVNMDNTEINGLYVTSTKVPSTNTTFRLLEADVQEGKLFQPNFNNIYFDLSGATIGDVKLAPDTSMSFLRPFELLASQNISSGNPIRYVRFFKTKFEGFQFGDYDGQFDELGWQIHTIHDEEIEQVTLEFTLRKDEESGGGSIERTRTISGEVMKPSSLASTYLNAKNGAINTGDQVAASKFFVKEMNYRREYYQSRAIDSLRDGLYRYRLPAFLHWGTRWLINSIWKLFGYGEKIWLIVLYIALSILVPAIIYPTISGIELNENLLVYSREWILESGNLSVLYLSIFISIMIFIGIGANGYTLQGEAAGLLAGLQALARLFLVPLFIFALGRKVYR